MRSASLSGCPSHTDSLERVKESPRRYVMDVVARGLAGRQRKPGRHGTAAGLIDRSHGGVPKLTVAEARVTTEGLERDRQGDLRAHGGSEGALCFASHERIA